MKLKRLLEKQDLELFAHNTTFIRSVYYNRYEIIIKHSRNKKFYEALNNLANSSKNMVCHEFYYFHEEYPRSKLIDEEAYKGRFGRTSEQTKVCYTLYFESMDDVIKFKLMI